MIVFLMWLAVTEYQLIIQILNPLVALATIMGIVIALFQFQWTNQSRQEDLSNKRFDYTKQALDYYVQEIVPLLDYDLTGFDDKMKQSVDLKFDNLAESRFRILEYVMISDFLENDHSEAIAQFQQNQIALINGLGRLSGYFYYDKVNTEQLLSIISYSINEFYHHRGIETSLSLLQTKMQMNNYQTVIHETEAYQQRRNVKYER